MAVFEYRQAQEIRDEEFPVCHIDDIIASKQAANRQRDRESLPRLLVARRKDQSGWWPQGGGPVRVLNGKWERRVCRHGEAMRTDACSAGLRKSAAASTPLRPRTGCLPSLQGNGPEGVCPELPGCASAGDTEEEARRNIEEAIRLYLEPSDVDLSPNAKLVEVTVG